MSARMADPNGMQNFKPLLYIWRAVHSRAAAATMWEKENQCNSQGQISKHFEGDQLLQLSG